MKTNNQSWVEATKKCSITSSSRSDAPFIPLYYDEVVQLRQKSVIGLHPNGMNLLKLETVDKK